MAQPQNLIPAPKDPGKIPVCPGTQFDKDWMLYLEDMALMHQMEKKLKQLAAALSHMKNVMYGVMEFMDMYQNVEGSKVKTLSDVENMDSDLRSQITDAEGIVNKFTSGVSNGDIPINGKPTPAQIKAMKALIGLIGELTAELKILKNTPELKAGQVAENLQNGINDIKGAFQMSTGTSFWGSPRRMAIALMQWVNSGRNNGEFSPHLKSLQFGFQTLNQTTSALSTSTNTNLQFVTAMFKQFLGIDKSAMDSEQELNSLLIKNQVR